MIDRYNIRWQRNLRTAIVNTSTNNGELVAAQGLAKIRFYAGVIVAQGAVLVSLRDGAGGANLTPPMSAGDTTGWVLPELEDGWNETSEGVSLNIGLSAVETVSGLLVYRYVFQNQ